MEYDFKDYIEKYSEFLKKLEKKKDNEITNYRSMWTYWLLHN